MSQRRDQGLQRKAISGHHLLSDLKYLLQLARSPYRPSDLLRLEQLLQHHLEQHASSQLNLLNDLGLQQELLHQSEVL